MIIKSRSARSTFHRRTSIADPNGTSLQAIVQSLLLQWNLIDDAAGQAAPDSSAYALLVAVQDCEDRLVIDKQDEWALFCAEYNSATAPAQIVEVELVTRQSILNRTSVQSNDRPLEHEPISLSAVEQLQAQVRQLSEQLRHRSTGEVHGRADKVPATESHAAQPITPKYAFHSVEPQKNKAKIPYPSSSAHPRTAPSPLQPSSAPPPAAEPQPAMSLDEIMARSRRQGESLNQLFGQLQARGAGRSTDQGDIHSSVEIHKVDDMLENEHSQVSLPLVAGQGDTVPASQFVEKQSNVVGERFSQDNAGEPTLDSSAEASGRPRRTAEEIGGVNAYLDNAWQERLAQMGHGPDSGSPYAKLRTGKMKGRAEDSSRSIGQSSDQAAADQIVTTSEPLSSSCSMAGPSSAPMNASKSNTGLVRSSLHALNEESTEELAMSVAAEPSFGYFSLPPSHSTTPVLEQSTAFRLEESQQRPGSASGVSSSDGGTRRFSLRGTLFKRNRVQSHEGLRAFNSQQNSGRATPDGAMTPRSFNSAVFRRRPLSVRSLSDALLGTARERNASNTPELDEVRSGNANTLPPSGSQPQSGTAQRPARRGHAAVRSLSDLSFLPQSARRRTRTNSMHNNSNEEPLVADSHFPMQEQVVESASGRGLRAQEATSIPPSSVPVPTLPQQQLSTPVVREQNRCGDINRPTLLRASHSSPMTSTAVNLSSAGGITLHISSIVSVRNNDENTIRKEQQQHFDTVADEPAVAAANAGVNLFDIMLPREIRLDCLRALIRLHEEAELNRDDANAHGGRRLRDKGRLEAMRALIRLSRVSRSWQSLIFDGQLWTTLDASLAKGVSDASLLRISRTAGPFIRSMNFSNMQHLSSSTFLAVTTPTGRRPLYEGHQAPPQNIPGAGSGRARAASMMRLPTTMGSLSAYNVALPSLTRLDVQGCRMISTDALHQALVRLPQVQHLNIANLLCVTNDTCLIIGASLPHLLSLNISRCPAVTGEGVTSLLQAAQGSLSAKALLTKVATTKSTSPSLTTEEPTIDLQDVALDMQELRAVGLREVDVRMMETAGRLLRYLRVLDLSYASDMSDEAISAFVRHPGPHDHGISSAGGADRRRTARPMLTPRFTKQAWSSSSSISSPPCGPFVTLTARQAGGNVQLDETHYRRVHPHLKHLSLSSCRGLTDRCCVNLAHALPQLRHLEMANIGNTLRENGVIKLLETTPLIARIDVEGAVELGERFVQAITPPLAYVESLGIVEASSAVSSSLLATRSIGRLGRRALRRGRVDAATSTTAASDNEQTVGRISEDRLEAVQGTTLQPPPTAPRSPPWTQAVPTGAHLSHLIVSHLWRLEGDSLLALVRHCPKLIHLEVDDTRANDAVLREFVALSRQRRMHGAYISLVDCRALSKSANTDVFTNGHARPRAGQSGDDFSCFHYERRIGNRGNSDVTNANATPSTPNRRSGQAFNSPSSSSSSSSATLTNGTEHSGLYECEDDLVVVKTFWAWQAVDIRVRTRRKAEAKRTAALAKAAARQGGGGTGGGEATKRSKKGRDSLAMALNFISSAGGGASHDDSDEEGNGRWSRFTTTLLGQGDEDDDPRACTIM